MGWLRDFVADVVDAYGCASFHGAVGTIHAENAVWRAQRSEWEAALWDALCAAEADPTSWQNLPSLVHQARKDAAREPIGGRDGITYRPTI